MSAPMPETVIAPAHTPGPWEAVGHAVHAQNGREILFGQHNTRSGTDAERRASARLIAAAPELFAALLAIANDTQGQGVGPEVWEQVWSALAEAGARVKGAER